MPRTGIALVMSAPSGAGKTTLTNMLLGDFPHFTYSISCTTRTPRPGEKDGVNYHFIDTELFLKRREEGFFAEWAQVHDHFYGTPLAPVQNLLAAGKDILFDIDVQGAAQLKKTLPEALFVFILPPSIDILEERLRGRKSDDAETIATRIRNAAEEIQQAHWYDALIVNDDLHKAYEELKAVYCAAKLTPARNQHLLNDLIAQARTHTPA